MDVVHHLRAVIAACQTRLPPGRLLVACSGGPDSTALADALATLAPSTALASVDHGLRAASAAESSAVVAWARTRGLDAAILRVTVDGKSMAAARRARYDALVAHAHALGAVAIAVAHSATDQAETLLDRLIRGAGTRGLSGMSPLRRLDGDLWLWRPLLSLPRPTIEAYVQARGLAVVRDPTNADRAYRRSRVRHEILPLLRRERPDLDVALAELCDRLRADADFLDAAAATAQAQLQDGDGSLDAAGLHALDEALFARVITRASGLPLVAAHVAALRRLCADRRGTHCLDLPARSRAERRYQRLRFITRENTRDNKSAPDVTVEVAVDRPGNYLLNGMGVTVSPELYQTLGAQPLLLRHPRRGDRLGGTKLSDLFITEKVPRPERKRLPILVRDGDVLWVSGLRMEARRRARHDRQRRLTGGSAVQ